MGAALIPCTNFGECGFADGRPHWPEFTVACPACGKTLASPHRVALGRAASKTSREVTQGTSCSLEVTVETRGSYTKALKLGLELDGVEYGASIKPGDTRDGQIFDLGRLKRGLYPFRAILETSDGRVTRSNQYLLLVASPRESFTIWIGTLILLLLLSLGLAVTWTSQVMFFAEPPAWLKGMGQLLLLLVSLSIGFVFLRLGLHERKWQVRAAQMGDPAVRRRNSLIQRQLTGETFPIPIAHVGKWLDGGNLWALLTFVGAVPICFFVATVVGSIVGSGLQDVRPELAGIAFLVAGVAIFLFVALRDTGNVASADQRMGDTGLRGQNQDAKGPGPVETVGVSDGGERN